MNACAVCATEIVNDPHGRERLYCSRACRMRAYRDRRDGRSRLLGGNDPTPLPRPGLARVAAGEYATRDGGARVVNGWGDARGWTVVYRRDDVDEVDMTYPTLRAARVALDVPLRRRAS